MPAERTPGAFGSTLRDARERRGLSLRQIADATKISVASLSALERGDFARLPGGIFSRAFVRAYAVEVGLDPDVMLEAFIAEVPTAAVAATRSSAGGPAAPRDADDNDAIVSEQRAASTTLRLLLLSVPIAGLVLYLGFTGRRTPAPTVETPARTDAARAPRGDGDAAVAPAAVETAASGTTGTAAEPGSVADGGAPVDAATASVTTSRTSTAAPAAASATPAAIDPPSAASAADRLRVALTATGPCWVSALVDGQRVLSRELRAGERVDLEVRRDVVLTAGDAAALTVTYNGAPAKPLGKSGEVVTTRVTVGNFKDALLIR